MCASPKNRVSLGNKREQAYQYIREQIVNNQLKPNTFIDEKHYSEILDISQTPVREAIQRLRSENLLEYIEGKGAVVTPVKFEDVLCIFELRIVLECFAAGKCVEYIDDDDVSAMRTILEKQRAAYKPNTIDHLQYDVEFHSYIAGKVNNPIVAEYITMALQRSRRYTTFLISNREYNSSKEHELILKALEDRDANGARDAMRAHLERTKEYNIEKFIVRNGYI